MAQTGYIGPMTGHRYDLAAGEKIDIAAEGISYTGDKASPHARINGRKIYKRIFIRLRTPQETLTFRPITDGADFARRAAIVEQWYNANASGDNIELLFEAREMSDADADADALIEELNKKKDEK